MKEENIVLRQRWGLIYSVNTGERVVPSKHVPSVFLIPQRLSHLIRSLGFALLPILIHRSFFNP